MKLATVIYGFLYNKTQASMYQITPYAILGVSSFLFFYYLNTVISPGSYENVFLRVLACALCVPLIFHRLWPKKLQYILPIYWYTTLLYMLPFFFVFMFLKNGGSILWQMNLLLLLFFLILLVDWLSFILLLAIGSILAVVVYLLTAPILVLPNINRASLITFLITCLIGALFANRKEKLAVEKLQAVQLMAASIAHELRTPLRGFGSSIRRVRETAGKLAASYKIAKEARVAVPEIKAAEVVGFLPLLDGMELGAKSAFTTIEMILMNATTGSSMQQKERYSINECVNEALERYPFDAADRELVHWDEKNSFDIYGDKTAIIHVIFNLLKNALYYIKAAGKGEIYIWLESGEKENKLYFKDTGAGIPTRQLSKIFERFYSTTQHGTGIGLAFCKYVMHTLGGEIICDSKEGEYTEFELTFPR